MHLIGEVSRTQLRPSYSKPWSKACREKSAKVIVPAEDSGREGLNPTEVNNHKRYRMKGGMQKISTQSDSHPQKDRPEAESYVGGRLTCAWRMAISQRNNLKDPLCWRPYCHLPILIARIYK